jgi:hypothetical protein
LLITVGVTAARRATLCAPPGGNITLVKAEGGG